MSGEKNILLTLHRLGESHSIQTKRAQYHSLMDLVSTNLAIPGFGLCGGMGSCGTCIVKLTNCHVLSCAIQVNDSLANTDIFVPDVVY